MKKKVLVAMSGGVDSSVAAALLKKQGFSCIGVFMHFWSEDQNNQSEEARRVAQKIGIPFYTVNYKKSFRGIVVDYYLAEYRAGRTPNPCVVCNQYIKFDLLLREAQKQGCDYLATGHYACIKKNAKGQLALFRSKDLGKDQTYFLYRLIQDKLKKILFPVGKYQKSEVRKIARKFDLPTADRKDSRGICFVAGKNEDFLRKYLKVKPGKICDPDGNEIGEHQGLLYYTVGQRQGFGNLNLEKSELGEEKANIPPLYVISVDIKNNTLIVGREKDLYQKKLITENISWILGKEPSFSKMGARIRYRHPINECKIKKIDSNKYQIVFKKSQRAITPGQSVVFYHGEKVLGGGIIV
jgi:tRNA-specific 2-thiouridylase